MKKLFLLLGITFCTFSFASPLPDFPFVTVTGNSEVDVAPDQVMVSFSVESFAESSEVANSQLNEAAQQAVKLILDSGVAEDEIKSFEVNKRVIRQETEDYNEGKILGYEFSQNVQFTLTALSKYPDLLQALLSVDLVGGIEGQFDLSDRSKVEAKLIKDAAKEAKAKAKMMADGLEVKLGPVYAINDSGSFNSFFATFGLDLDRISVSAARYRSPAQTIFVPKTIKISKSINVVYKLDI